MTIKNIRKYQENDLNSIIEIWLEASFIAHDFIEKSYWLSKVDDMKNKYIPDSDSFIYIDNPELGNDKIIGFISLIDNYIAAIFVNPEFQGKGIGSELINYAKRIHEELKLDVYSQNVNSVNFYKKHGFEISEEKIDRNTGHKELSMIYKK